jgi:hypothetical protein
MKRCPEPDPSQRVREASLASSEIGGTGTLCARAHQTLSDRSIEKSFDFLLLTPTKYYHFLQKTSS